MSHRDDWVEEARGIAAQFRLGMSVSAALTLVEFVGRLVKGVGPLPASLEQELAALVGGLLACQEAHDWLGLADYLEVELADWLNRYGAAGGNPS